MKIDRNITAKFYTPGTFVGETFDLALVSDDPTKVGWPSSAYAFQMYETRSVTIDGEVYKSAARGVGPLYYHPDSKVMTREQIEARNDPNDRILLSNMQCNKWSAVVFTRWGNWPQPADDIEILNRSAT